MMEERKLIQGFMLSLVLFVSLVGFASAVSQDLNLVISSNVNGIASDFQATTSDGSSVSFDGDDVPVVLLPSNYTLFFSRLCAGTGSQCRLSVDSWSKSENTRTLDLEFTSVNPTQTGLLNLSWSTFSNQYHVNLTDYGTDPSRTNVVNVQGMTQGGMDMSKDSGYLMPDFSATRYFRLRVENISAPVVENDVTPPASVTGLTYTIITNSSIHWKWNNPSLDFAEAIIFIGRTNLVNLVNTSLNNYNATGLLSNTSYTIKVYTKDLAGNVNNTPVTDIRVTLPVTSNINSSVNNNATGGYTPGDTSGNNNPSQNNLPGLPVGNVNNLPVAGSNYTYSNTGNKSSGKNDANGGSGKGTIYVLIAVLVGIIGAIGFVIVRAIRNARLKKGKHGGHDTKGKHEDKSKKKKI